ncbi:hypothetical protein C482_15963 [Natrialba chahannaoensis JCM 10990]|uniref:HTTM-like domain-containing protein n=1 Tax=Natrialba chahannaoensis JCM 10990 TaxID=1227492 RepID=M0ACQ2_9EURY|nr:HTTM domain-containing protein [Natrialba chahannaoensis]ELY96510.1 hypothetical protein C482_15963 [Natrialba chahannaoensis JCM 10990]
MVPSASAISTLRTTLRERVRIDTRTLALVRIAFALLILADLFLRARNFSYFYTEAGPVPQSLALAALSVDAPSVYFLTTDPAGTAALFVVHGVLAVLLLVGYHTRVATALSLVFVLSLDLRNPLVLSYADTLFVWLLFWGIFLPLGERWSVDAVHADREPRASVASIGSALALFQMITMYVVNGYHKSNSELWQSGEAAVLVFGLDDMTFLLADSLHAVPALLQAGGLAWYYMLCLSGLLVLARGRLRTGLVSIYMVAHLSFAVTVRIGAFAFVALAGLLLFLQSSFWDDLSAVARKLSLPTTTADIHRPVQTRLPLTRRHHTNHRLPTATGLATRLPRLRLEYTANLTHRIRHNPTRTVVATVVAIGAVVALVSVLSAGGLVSDDIDPATEIERGATGFIDHQTEWSIFAPEPRTTDRYYIFPAVTASGERLDVYNDRALTFDRPYENLQHQYETYRERFYMNSVGSSDPPETTALLAEHICTEWNEAHDGDDELTHLTMYQVQEQVTRETIGTPNERNRSAVLLHRHGCDGNEPIEIVDSEWDEDGGSGVP